MRLKTTSVIVGIAVILSVFMAGCTSTTSNTQSQSGESNNSVSISANAAQSPQQIAVGSSSLTPANGHRWAMYNVTFTDINAQSLSVYSQLFTVQDTSNNTYPIANFNQDSVTNHFPAVTTIHPGQKVNGIIAYDVPQNVKLVTMTYDDSGMHSNAYRHIVIKI